MRSLLAPALVLLLGSAALAQSGSPPAPGYVGAVDWIHVPGISATGNYTISWGTAAWYVEAHELEEDADSAFGSPTQVYSGTGQSWAASGRSNGTYYYRVRGINNTYSTQGPWLDADHPQVVDSSVGTVPSVPSAPSTVNVPASSSSGLIPISWSSVTGAGGYDVQVQSRWGVMPPSPNFWSGFATVGSDIAATSFTHTGTNNLEYQFRVRAWVAAGSYKLYSLWSSASTNCLVVLATPSAPATITVPAGSWTGTYTVSWSSETSSAAYELEEDTNSGFPAPVQVYQGAATSYQVTGRSNGSYYYRVRGTNALYQGSYAAGANPCVVSLRGTLTLSLGPANPGGTELPGTLGAPVVQLTMVADGIENITVTSLTVTHSGTLLLSPDATGASLYADLNGDGRKDAGDALLASAAGPSGTTIAFTGLSRTVNASSSEAWLVVYDLAAGAPVGATFRGSVANTTDVAATGSVSANPFVAGPPVQGPQKTVQTVGSLAVMPGPGNPAASETVAGLTGVAVLEIEVAAGPVEAVTLTALAVQGDGTGDEAAGIGGAFLYLDANANHAFESGLDMLLAGPQTFAADDGKVTFAVSRPIPANGSEFYFVVYSFGAAAPGSTFRANFASNADASGAGALSGKAVSVSGAPVQGGTFTVAEQVSPSDVRRGGSCGGGTSPAGPGAAPGLALLALACAAARAAARKRRATPEA